MRIDYLCAEYGRRLILAKKAARRGFQVRVFCYCLASLVLSGVTYAEEGQLPKKYYSTFGYAGFDPQLACVSIVTAFWGTAYSGVTVRAIVPPRRVYCQGSYYGNPVSDILAFTHQWMCSDGITYQDVDVPVANCKCDGSSDPSCVKEETYTIQLEPKSATLEPSTAALNTKTAQDFIVTVTGDKNGVKAGATITIKADVEQGSGGHIHTDNLQRPKGYLGRDLSATLCDPNALQPQACITGTTDAKGQFAFVFSAPEPSGKHTITATCDVCKNNQDQAKISVKVEGLVSLSGNSTDYVLVGDTPTHSDNHYLTPTAKALAERLAIEYRKKFPKDPRLHFNDASLIDGGVLDICTEKETSEDCAYYLHYAPICELQPNGTYACSWSRPHIEHRRGSVIDVRANNIKPKAPNYSTSIPKRNEQEFLDLAYKLGINTGSRPHSPNSSNRHWHIRLLGVAE